MVNISQFINELRRRNVFRSGVAYVVVAWLLIQVADILLEAFAAPAWSMRAIVIALAVGFPVVLILAWVYEITTQGVMRTEAVSEGELISVHTGRQMDFVIIGVLIVAVALFAADRFRWIDFGTGHLRSIAVLALENLSGDPEQEYFVNGMTDTLITELSKIAALRVISRQSSMQFQGTKLSLPEIARQLNVDWVVEGSALLIGDQVRITVQLIEAATDQHLWADNYDRDLSDVLAIHSEVASAIAREINIVVTPEDAARLADVREVNPEAYRLYLLGRHFHTQWRPEALDTGIEYYRQAIAIDPRYAEAHVGVAGAHLVKAFMGVMRPRDIYQTVQAELALALEIDSNLADAHAVNASLLFYYDWDWEQAEEEFQRAVSLNPNHYNAHLVYTWYLAAMDRPGEAHASIRRILDLNPLDITAYLTASDAFYMSRQYDKAIAQIQEAVNLNLTSPFVNERLGWSYLQKSMFQEAIGEFERGVQAFPGISQFHWLLGHAYAVAGRTAEAQKILDELHGLDENQYVLPYGFAIIYTALGENEIAIEWLEKAFDERNLWMPFLNVEPRFDSLRREPEFQDLLRRMNFPE
ncbi:MAG: tetratricopeptide repeat protein [Proteobacteria bacterium]|nr:tetratricopeptide repeat protein [Pseudomonadota bacterium]